MDVKLPKLGEGADSGVVVSILVKEGDPIKQGQTLLELENEKAVAPIPSPVAGTVGKIRVKEGDKLSVGHLLMTVTASGEAPAADAAAKATPAKAAARAVKSVPPAPEPEPQPQTQPAVAPTVSIAEEPEPTGPVPSTSPTIRKLAKDLGIDLRRVKGSAKGGRVVLEDVRAYIQRLQQLALQPRAVATKPVPAAPVSTASAPVSIDFSQWGPVSRKALSPLRKTISRRLHESWSAVPRVTQFDEADITVLNDLRKKHAAAYEAKGGRLTLTSFALKAVADTLRKFPVFNSSLDEATDELVFKDYFHIGLAVDTEAGLIVPVIRNVDQKNLLQLSKEVQELAEKARERKVSGEELKGGTFTISNQGGIGGGHFTPIVNRPEVAILGLGRGALKPVVREGRIEPRLIMPVAISYDHRVIDGGTAARFSVELVKAFEGFADSDVGLR